MDGRKEDEEEQEEEENSIHIMKEKDRRMDK